MQSTIVRDSWGIRKIAIRDHSMLLGEREESETSLRHQRVFFQMGERSMTEKKKCVYVTGHILCAGRLVCAYLDNT
jgi:hypothetical protein